MKPSQLTPPAAGSSGEGVLDRAEAAHDPLSRARSLQTAAASVGFDWPDPRGAFAKVREEVAEVETAWRGNDRAELEAEVGDLLFAAVNVTRLCGVDPAAALGAANAKFLRRFHALEIRARAAGIELKAATLEALDALWDEVKRDERSHCERGNR
ncbi:hypothetical protein BH20GEM2_BH20GEM2_11950 [soil metagenome]